MKAVVGAIALCSGLASAHSVKGSASARLAALDSSDRAFFLNKRKDVPPAEVQHEVEKMMGRIENLPSGHDKVEYVNQLVGVEEALAERTGAAGSFASKALVDEIASSRAALCVEQGFEKHETVDCETFMRVTCSLIGKSGDDKKDTQGPPVSATSCHLFFQEAQRETTGAETTEDTADAIRAEEAERAEAAQGDEVAIIADASNGTNGSAGFFGGKLDRDLPEQGYNEYEDGVMVKHKNVHTKVSNWLHEGEGRSIEAICREFPDNEWCQLHTQDGVSGTPGGNPRSVHFMAGSDVPSPPAEEPAAYVPPPAAPVELHASASRSADDSGPERSGSSAVSPVFVVLTTAAFWTLRA